MTGEHQTSGVGAHEQEGGRWTALAEGTASVEPAGEAERAMAAKSDALVTWVKGVARCEVEKTPQRASTNAAQP